MLPGAVIPYLALIFLSKGVQEEMPLLLQEESKKMEFQRRSDFPSTQRLSRSLEHCAGLLQYNKPISLAQKGLEFSFKNHIFLGTEMHCRVVTSPSLTSFGPILSCNVKFCLTRTSNNLLDLLDVWMRANGDARQCIFSTSFCQGRNWRTPRKSAHNECR